MRAVTLLGVVFSVLTGCQSGVVEQEMDRIRARYAEDEYSDPRFSAPDEIRTEVTQRLFPELRFHRIEWSEIQREGAPGSHRALGLVVILCLGPDGWSHRLSGSGNYEEFGVLLRSQGHTIHTEADALDTWRAFCDIHRKAWDPECLRISPTVWHLGVSHQDDFTYYTEVVLDEQGVVQSWMLKYGPGPTPPAPVVAPGAMRPFRLGVAARPGPGAMERVSPLSYSGGFQAKTMVFETLVRRDAEGRLAAGLASSWRAEDDGRVFLFTLREGAQFHDGTPVTAAAVRTSMLHWVGQPEHEWLGATMRIDDIVVESRREFRVLMNEPHALAADLCAINPCAVQAQSETADPGATPVGSGPFRLVEERENGTVLRLQRVALPGSDDSTERIDLVLFDPASSVEPVTALLDGEVDALIDGWRPLIPRDRVSELEADPRFGQVTGPGSSVHYLSFRLRGPTADLGLRSAIAAAVDRADLIESAEQGLADPCTAWAAPTVAVWPRGTPVAAADEREALEAPLILLVRAEVERECAVASVLVNQLRRADLPVEIQSFSKEDYERRVTEGRFDLRFEHTWGIPYDPLLSLQERFPAEGSPGDEELLAAEVELSALAAVAAALSDPGRRTEVYGHIQAVLDREALLVPLFVPHRIGFFRKDRSHPGFHLDHDLHRIAFR